MGFEYTGQHRTEDLFKGIAEEVMRRIERIVHRARFSIKMTNFANGVECEISNFGNPYDSLFYRYWAQEFEAVNSIERMESFRGLIEVTLIDEYDDHKANEELIKDVIFGVFCQQMRAHAAGRWTMKYIDTPGMPVDIGSDRSLLPLTLMSEKLEIDDSVMRYRGTQEKRDVAMRMMESWYLTSRTYRPSCTTRFFDLDYATDNAPTGYGMSKENRRCASTKFVLIYGERPKKRKAWGVMTVAIPYIRANQVGQYGRGHYIVEVFLPGLFSKDWAESALGCAKTFAGMYGRLLDAAQGTRTLIVRNNGLLFYDVYRSLREQSFDAFCAAAPEEE